MDMDPMSKKIISIHFSGQSPSEEQVMEVWPDWVEAVLDLLTDPGTSGNYLELERKQTIALVESRSPICGDTLLGPCYHRFCDDHRIDRDSRRRLAHLVGPQHDHGFDILVASPEDQMRNIFSSFLLPFFAAVTMPIFASLLFFSKEGEAGAIFMLAWAVLIASGQICAEIRAMKKEE